MPIFVDSRGKGEQEIAKFLKDMSYPVIVKALDSGDFFISGNKGFTIGVERKTANDLYSSIVGSKKSWSKTNRHFWTQVKNLSETYKRPIILIEGEVPSQYKVVIEGACFSLKIGWGIPILRSRDNKHTAEMLGQIYDKYGDKESHTEPPPIVKKGKHPREIKLAMLQCVEGIGMTISKRILDEESLIISTVLDPDYLEKKLSTISGLGTKSGKQLRKRLLDVLYGLE